MQPNIVKTFVRAINDHDLASFLSCFTPEGVIEDDNNELAGPQLEAFFQGGIIGRNASIDIVASETTEQQTKRLYVQMRGNFVENYGIHEPFDLWFEFILKDDHISRLKMGDVDPSKPTMLGVYAAFSNVQDPLSVLRVGRRNVPEPRPGWILVKLQAVGINYHDIFTLRGIGMRELRYPLMLGCEGAGTLPDGTEVAIYPTLTSCAPYGDETLDPGRQVLGELEQGTMAEYVLVPEKNAIPRPKGVSARSAAVLGIAWITAYRMLFVKSGLRAGQSMLVQGSSGGVTSALIQMGSAAGFRVLATGRTASKRALALELGAQQVFEPATPLPHPVDAAFDTSGAATLNHSISSVRAGGTVVVCGMHSGGQMAEVDLLKLFADQVTLTGVYTGTMQEFRDLLAFVDAKGIVPRVGKVWKLEEAKEGFREFLDGKTDGKLVVEMGGT